MDLHRPQAGYDKTIWLSLADGGSVRKSYAGKDRTDLLVSKTHVLVGGMMQPMVIKEELSKPNYTGFYDRYERDISLHSVLSLNIPFALDSMLQSHRLYVMGLMTLSHTLRMKSNCTTCFVSLKRSTSHQQTPQPILCLI